MALAYTPPHRMTFFILAVYVDDILLAGKSEQKIAQLKSDLGRRYQLKDTGKLNYFLGVSDCSCTAEVWNGALQTCQYTSAAGTKLVKAAKEFESIDTIRYQSVLAVYCICLDGPDLT